MKLVSIGHLSWLISDRGYHILIDPILSRDFGTSKEYRFEILPARVVSVSEMPLIDCVLLTSEHLQHFHLPSFLELVAQAKGRGRTISVYVPGLAPISVSRSLTEIGCEVFRMSTYGEVKIGCLKVTFFLADRKTLFWDNRGASLHIENGYGVSVFLQSDISIPDSVFNHYGRAAVSPPNLMVLTNNFNRSLGPNKIGLDNLLPIDDARYKNVSGLRLLHETLTMPVKRVVGTGAVNLSGNGFRAPLHIFDPIWSNSQLVEIANELSLGCPVFSIQPGDSIELETLLHTVSDATWVSSSSNYKFSERKICSIPRKSDADNLRLISLELEMIAKCWIINRFGLVLMAQHAYLGRPLGTRRFTLQLISSKGSTYQFDFDIANANFVATKYEGPSAQKKFPFGVIASLEDLAAVVRGELQIWEMINISASQWYICDRYDSPLAFFLEFYSEQVDSDKAYSTYQHSMVA